jgi:hypothetical protein
MTTITITIRVFKYKVHQTPGLNYMGNFEYKFCVFVYYMAKRYTAVSV